ncbi:MAG: FISUMP domain-containing protein [Bacteroidales bacterium]|jgi:uncharacterized protein (TIGR02145 family)
MKKLIIFFAMLAFFTIKNQAQTVVTDADGNVYDTVQIGTQVWLQENLATTKFNDGTTIPLVSNQTQWFHLTTPGYCWYKNDSAGHKAIFGALYNWYTVNTNKLCPAGWHVPSNYEWHKLIKFLDPAALDCYCTESTVAATMLKETGTTMWFDANGTNSSRFNAVEAGYRNYYDSSYEGNYNVTFLWTSTPNTPYNTKWHRYFGDANGNVFEYLDQPTQGMSVRCVQDTVTTGGLNDILNKEMLKIYPNPATNNITIEVPQPAIIDITNIQGQIIKTLKTIGNKTNIDISAFPDGVYVVEMKTEKGIKVNKFMKE